MVPELNGGAVVRQLFKGIIQEVYYYKFQVIGQFIVAVEVFIGHIPVLEFPLFYM